MKIQSASPDGQNLITSYDADTITVNGVAYHSSLIVTPQRVISPWPCSDISELDAAAIESLAEFADSIIVLGTGPKQHFPATAVLREFRARGMAVEVMDSHAACRTYNILVTEARKVVAALMIAPRAAA
jgi:uncharacterized protein